MKHKKACLLNSMHKPLLYGIVYTLFIWIYWSNSDDCKRLGLVLETRNERPVVLPHSLYTILMILNEDWSFKRKKWRSFYDFFLFSSPSPLYQYTITVGYISDYILLSSIDCDVNGSLRTQQLTHVLLTVLNKPLEKQTYQSFQVDLFVLNRC